MQENNKSQSEPNFLPILPLKNVVALPKSIIPVIVGRDFSVKGVEFALRNTKNVFLTAQKKEDTQVPERDDMHEHGTRATILQVAHMPNGTLKILVECIVRATLVSYRPTDGFLGGLIQDKASQLVEDPSESKALIRNVCTLFKQYVALDERASKDILDAIKDVHDLDYLTDTVAVHMQLDADNRQKFLEMVSVRDRAIKLCVLLKDELEILRVEHTIRKRVQRQVEKHQKDYYLNEQMRAIQRELGKEDYYQEIKKIKAQAKRLKLPSYALVKVEEECKRLESMPQTSPEAAVTKNYLETLLSLPWHKESKDSITIIKAEKILDASHAAMKKPKERIIEFLATKKYAGSHLKRSPIICLSGPPGVGKTSLAQSIAESLGRPLIRISLGGLRDEAEIRGHRKTYIGAMPGKIIQAMRKAKVVNPVILLDEVDKMAMDFRGDPASALLEVLDPEQNKSFSDHFLEIEYDLSKVMFITTANVIDAIPYALLDRMEVISLAGYTDKEKITIARHFLLPKLLKEHKLRAKQVILTDQVLDVLIDQYTKEAGVRQLERALAKLLRKAIQVFLKDKKVKSVTIDHELLAIWLGSPKFKRPDNDLQEHVGLATGLAWTEVGGDILDIEINMIKGKGGLSLTGQLGEVMQESAQAALTYLRSRAQDLCIKPTFNADLDIHIHVPEGATPKDGPSAGITIAAALASGATKIPIKKGIAMTGEITLRGRILPVGGLKEKLLAAIRFGYSTVIVPEQNRTDIKEFETELEGMLTIIYVATMDEVLHHVLVSQPVKKKRTSRLSPSAKKTQK